MSPDFFSAVILAAFKALLKQYPGLALAAVLAQLQEFGEEVANYVKEGLSNERGWPGPRLEYDESGTPTGWYFDIEGNRKHYMQEVNPCPSAESGDSSQT